MAITVISERFIRLCDAPVYLGMGRHLFDQLVRPYIKPIPLGKRGIGFDRLDLDAWADYYKEYCCERPSTERSELWDVNARQDSTNVKEPGTLINISSEDAFAKAVAQSLLKKQKNT